ncbi:MAG: hypothetical protein WCT10_03070 [Patescibacteria group bacterium]|jgi:hypothetical protein
MGRSLKEKIATSGSGLVRRIRRWLVSPLAEFQELRRQRALVKRQLQYALATQYLVGQLRYHGIEVLEYEPGDHGPRVRARVHPEQSWVYCLIYSAVRQHFPGLTEAELCDGAEPGELLTAAHGFRRRDQPASNN